MKTIIYPDKSTWQDCLQRPTQVFESLEKRIRPILDDVKQKGDEAVIEYTKQFDKVDIESIAVTEKEYVEADSMVDDELKEALKLASANIEKFHSAQKQQVITVETMTGVRCWQKSLAIEKVGLYVPGGTAPLFSSVLMLGIPATIAGCKEIVLCTPPQYDGTVNPAILYAAKLTGIDKVFRIGGVQSVAAMAFGTESVPAVYKIFGPGNQYVTAAKQLVTRYGVAIDMPAGPSEVAVMADSSCNPSFVASDLLSQAEHGIDSQVILVCNDKQLLDKIKEEVKKQLETISRKEFAAVSISNSKAFLLKDTAEMIQLVNQYAPEHLIISMKNYSEVADRIRNAGSVFLGNYTPESAGDYASGTNHTLPTNGYARNYNGVNLDSFIKKITFQEISRDGLNMIGPVIQKLAIAEELDAHARAVAIRMDI
jgi:histidinol dehydrogenase